MKEITISRLFLLVLLVLLGSGLLAQKVQVTGKVTSGEEPLIGVNILEKGTSNGAVTDVDGNFSISVNPDGVLQISYLGYNTIEEAVAGRTVINISMVEVMEQLTEVVVTGYGTQQKINVTGSVGSIKNEDLTVVPVASTTGLLSGRVPGVITKQNSGLPGSDNTTIRIRGFQGSPLVLVDGVEMVGGLTRIDPNDIESISILKDASAAVYGSRAGNGVILVTTKRGQKGPARISYDGSLTLQEATAFLQHTTAAQYVELRREADLNDIGDINATFTEEDLANYKSGAPGYEGGDWVDALVKNFAPMQQHSLKVSGGTDNVRYFTSLGMTQQEGYFRSRDYDYDRINARTNIDVDINKNLSFNMDLSYRYDWRESARDPSGIFNDLQTSLPIYPTEIPDPELGVAYAGFSQRNPIASSSQKHYGWTNRRDDTFRGKIGIQYNFPFVDGLKIKAEVNTVQVNRATKVLSNSYHVWQYNQETDTYVDHGVNRPRTAISDAQFRSNQLYPLLSVEYAKTIADHDFKLLAVGEQLTRKFNSVSAQRQDLLSTLIPELFSGSEDLQTNFGSSGSNIGRKSFIGRLNYKFKQRYLFEATFRADGNVLFSPERRWGYFPSVSAGWIMSQEPFMQGTSNVIDRLKLRASYSQLGDDTANGLSGFDYLTGYAQVNSGKPYILGNNSAQPQIQTLGLVNPLLTWEEITLYNIGFEVAFLQGKLDLEADFFYRNREGLLGQNLKAIPSTFGGALPLVNLNSRTNRGVELQLTYRQRIGDLRLDISPNITFARAKWGNVFDEEKFTDPDQLRIFGRENQWVNRNFGYISDGIFMNQAEIDNHSVIQDDQDNSTLRPGDIKYVDLNSDGVIDFRDQDQIAYASGLPDFAYGLILGANYKGLSLNVLLQGASRFSINISGSARNMFSNFSTPLTYHYDLRWQPAEDNPGENVNPNAQLPAATISPGANNARNSDFYRYDVTYLRLKNINLGFDIPQRITSKVGINHLQLYVAGENIFTLSNLGIYKNSFDPEAARTSPSRNYPLHRNITFGLRVSL